MPWWAWCLCILWFGICLVWVRILIAQFQVRRDGLLLTPEPFPPNAQQPWPTVTVVIPARNESSGLDQCLKAVAQQDYPAMAVVVIDDRSDDDTFAVARNWADVDPRFRARQVRELPPGWMGKSHALWTATRDLTHDWLLFIDVDCRLDPAAVRTAVTEAKRRDAQFLTLWPRIRAGSFFEHLLIPLCAGIIALWFGSKRTNDPDAPQALGMGAFLLIERAAYEDMGGHRAVRDALIEDVPLAELAKASGQRCWVASGRNIADVRMYTTYQAIRDGWARIYVGALRSPAKIAASILWLLAGSLWPYLCLSALLIMAAIPTTRQTLPSPASTTTAALSVAHLLLILIVSYRFWGLGNCKRVYLWLYPLSVLAVIAILFRAWWWLTIRRTVSWRTTTYQIDQTSRIIT